jgi:hypothetical protein
MRKKATPHRVAFFYASLFSSDPLHAVKRTAPNTMPPPIHGVWIIPMVSTIIPPTKAPIAIPTLNALTEYGWSLKGILDSLCAWGERHIEKTHPNKDEVLVRSEEMEQA